MTISIYAALQKAFQILGLSDRISLFSYSAHFAILWNICDDAGGCATVENDKGIWCVVDDGNKDIKRLHIGIWGRYFRAKIGKSAPKIMLVGRDEFINPPENGGLNISIPDFYEDTGLCTLSFFSPNLLKNIINFASKSENDIPSRGQIAGLQAIVYRTLTAEGSHHAVSNEIAPAILKGALSDLFDTHFADSDDDKESRALLQLWEWSTAFLYPKTPSEKPKNTWADKPKKFMMDDIWNVWSNARFLLIDDQAESHGYKDIIRHALKIMIGDSTFSLTSQTSVTFGKKGTIHDSEIDNILNNFDCLFLDIRLRDTDQKEVDYNNLTGIKIVKQLFKKDRSFPIVIFSSSQKREIENILSKYKNVITGFRKPGIAGSIDAIDGCKAVESLFDAISNAFRMIENRQVYNRFKELQNNPTIYTHKRFEFVWPWKEAKKLFEHVFLYGRYDKAFDYPYSFFENLFAVHHEELKSLCYIKLKAVNENKYKIENAGSDGKLQRLYLKTGFEESKLLDFIIDGIDTENSWYAPETIIRLHLRTLAQLRNMESHGIRDFSSCRREAIIILLLFIDIIMLKKKRPTTIFDGTIRKDIGNLEIECDRKFVFYPLIRPFHAQHNNIKQYINEIFSSVFYLIGSDFHKPMYDLLRFNLSEKP